MSRIDDEDGGPAFPRPEAWATDGSGTEDAYEGMSLRDWFAGQALAGVLASFAGLPETSIPDAKRMATDSYALADAMLRARKAGGQ